MRAPTNFKLALSLSGAVYTEQEGAGHCPMSFFIAWGAFRPAIATGRASCRKSQISGSRPFADPTVLRAIGQLKVDWKADYDLIWFRSVRIITGEFSFTFVYKSSEQAILCSLEDV